MKSSIKPILLFVIAVWMISCTATKKYPHSFLNPSLKLETRVDSLVALLTIEEKVQQMMNNAPAIKRLGIPAYNWWNECLHGVARSPYHATSFPQAIAMAATWDTLALYQMATYASDEGRAIHHDAAKKGKTGIYLGLTFWSPNINIFRDPRWGRGQETYGEDPYLTGALGKAFVRGLEGNDPKYLKTSACAKHFAVHSGPEWSRSTYNAVVSNYDLWDTYLPAFRDLIVDAKVSGVMCAYNAFDGEPCCGSGKLMNDILRKNWKFKGYVTSDCGGIGHFYRTHKTHPNAEAAAADAVLHGTDCECANNGAYKALHKSIADGLITEKQIDVSVKRLFAIRFRLGMFDPKEMVPYANIALSVLESAEHKAHALKMAQQSIVLLKNENNVLPLSKKIKKIAVVGPNASDEKVLLGNYYGYPTKVTGVLEGLRNKLGADVEIIYEKGINLTDNIVFKSSFNSKNFSSAGSEGFKAEYFQNTKWEGAPTLTRVEKLINSQWGDGENITDSLIARQLSIRWTADYTPEASGEISFELKGDDGARLIIDGEKKMETSANNPYYTFAAEKGKTYKVVIEYWQHSDNAEIKLDMGMLEKATPQTIAARVKDADVILFVGGISPKLEGEDMKVEVEGFRGGDRTSIALPAIQTNMMKELKATGKPVVFINMSGSAIGFEWEAANLPAIIQAWYGGQSGGTAVADVLFGDYNPSGRLPVTFYKNVTDLPDFEDYSMNNRTYRYFKGEPLYPFGFGMSYSNYEYSNLELTGKTSVGNNMLVKVTVTNTGKMDGEEVAQLYLSHKNAGFKTPIRVLKGFQRVGLKAGEAKTIQFMLTTNELTEINALGNPVPMQGQFEISVGGAQPSAAMIAGKKVLQQLINIENK